MQSSLSQPTSRGGGMFYFCPLVFIWVCYKDVKREEYAKSCFRVIEHFFPLEVSGKQPEGHGRKPCSF